MREAPAGPRCCRIHAVGSGARPSPWRKGPRRLPFHLLVLSLDGAEDVEIDGRRHHVPAGGAYLIAAGLTATIGAPAGNRPVFVHCDLVWDGLAGERARWSWSADPTGSAMPPPQPPPSAVLGAAIGVRPPPAVERVIRRGLPQVAALWSRGDPWSVAQAENRLEALFLAWAGVERLADDEATTLARIVRAESVALQHLDDAFGVEAFAAVAGLSRSRFHDVYRRFRSEPPGDFLRRARLEAASASLLGGGSLAEAAAACGFTDRAAFSRFFARSCGLPPGRWRARSRP